jgi:type 1 glutamine amidotransferase
MPQAMSIVRRTHLVAVALLLSLPAFSAEPLKKPTIVLIAGEYEYQSTNTLPAFKTYLETNYPLECIYLERTPGQSIPGLEALHRADLAIFFIRRMTLPEEELSMVRKYVQSGKPLIGLRTASHAFENWKEFDHEVLGGNYHNHHGDKFVATAKVAPDAAGHPILNGVPAEFVTGGSLYQTSPLATNTVLLLIGRITNQPPEPMAWTHSYKGARVFYTSLGHPKDFENSSFRRMLVNAIFWALNPPAPAK